MPSGSAVLAGAIFLVLFAVSNSGRGADGFDGEAVSPEATWRRAAIPEELGWSSAKLAKAKSYSQEIGSAAVVIVDNSTVVAEWGYSAVPYQIHSIRKPGPWISYCGDQFNSRLSE